MESLFETARRIGAIPRFGNASSTLGNASSTQGINTQNQTFQGENQKPQKETLFQTAQRLGYAKQQSPLQRFGSGVNAVSRGAESLGIGLDKSVLGLAGGLGKIGEQMQGAASNIPGLGFLKPKPNPIIEGMSNIANQPARDTLESVGKIGGDIAQFFIPGANVEKASILTKSVIGALDFGARTMAQSGGNWGETTRSAIVGGITPPALKVAGKVAPSAGNIVAEVLSKMSGVNAEDIKIAFKNPVEVARKMAEKLIPADVRTKAVGALQSFRTKYLDQFEQGLENIKGAYKEGPALESSVKQFLESGVKRGTLVLRTGLKEAESIPGIFRKFAVSVSEGILNFEKLNSSIVKAGEQKNLQAVHDTIRNQSDFSVKGMQRVASRINALSSFAEGAKTESSAIISRIHDLYGRAIENTYPELGNLRSVYATASKIYSEIDSVLKSAADSGAVDPGKVTTAVKKLSSLFNDNNEAYLQAIQKLEQVSGVDLINDLAASSFRDISPKSFGSRLGEVALLAGGLFHNPLDLLVIPLFSPRLQGKISTTAGRFAPYAGKAVESTVRAAVPFFNTSRQ